MNIKFVFSLFLTIISFSSCNFIDPDVTSFNFILPQKEFTVDSDQFNLDMDSQTMPIVDCDLDQECIDAGGEGFFCDSNNTCSVQVNYSLKSEKILLKEEVEEFAVVTSKDHVSVSFEYIQMDIFTNTLNFSIPPLKIYIAPQNVTALYNENNELHDDAKLIGDLDTINAGDTGLYDINLAPEGKQILTEYVSHPDIPFYFFVAGSIIFQGGDPVPSGTLNLKVHSMAKAQIE